MQTGLPPHRLRGRKERREGEEIGRIEWERREERREGEERGTGDKKRREGEGRRV